MSAISTLTLSGLAAAAVAVAGAPPLSPGWLWNTTASAPVGAWRLRPDRDPTVGQWVAVRPPAPLAAALAASGVLPSGVLLLKQLAAVAPARVCRAGDVILIDGRTVARARARDRRRRALPQWRGCRALQPGEVFVLNHAEGSFDSRYFGPLPRAAIVAEARPVFTTGGL